MAVTDEQKQPLIALENVLSDMGGYLERWATACEELSGSFHTDKASSLEKLTQIMEGLAYCPQLFESAITLLMMNTDSEVKAVAKFNEELARIFDEIEQAAANGDYSMVADLTEYDLVPAIHTAQKLQQAILRHCAERIV